jgi:DNA-directed RNA polymerase subunit RPC12/RpoP
MKNTEQIRCKECGHRVLYKPRTHRSEYSDPVLDYIVYPVGTADAS